MSHVFRTRLIATTQVTRAAGALLAAFTAWRTWRRWRAYEEITDYSFSRRQR